MAKLVSTMSVQSLGKSTHELRRQVFMMESNTLLAVGMKEVRQWLAMLMRVASKGTCTQRMVLLRAMSMLRMV